MTPDAFRLRVKLWGVRGSTPTPEAENSHYGGNTTCFEIQNERGERLIVDAGSGIRKLGLELAAQNAAADLQILLTHFHWDHIQGLPFFVPLLQPGNKITFHSFPGEEETHARLARQMSDPYFTLGFSDVGAQCEYSRIERSLQFGSFSVTPFPLNHPQGACGYRVECQGATVVIATDLEHGDPQLDALLREHSEGAHLLIYDAQYSPEEYESRKGWGHSTYLAAASVAHDAKVEKLILHHHDPAHQDIQVARIEEEAKLAFQNTQAAREQETLTIT